MAVGLDTRIPLAAVYDGPNWVERQRTAQEFEQRQKASALELRLAELKAARDADVLERRQRAGRRVYSQMQQVEQGQPAQYEPVPMNQGPVINQPFYGQMREASPAVPSREMSPEEINAAMARALFAEGDYDGAFEAMKAARSGQVSQMKPFGGETKIGADGQAYAFNQASGRYEPTGFYPQAAPEKQEKPVQVRTSRGIEFVTPKPGMVLKPPVEPQKTEKPVSAPAPSIDESKNAGFYQRMSSVSEMLNRYERNGKPTGYTSMVGGIPVIGQYLQRGAMTPDQARYRNAAMAWIRAKLRKESGAVIGDDEARSEYETYFPLPNDRPEVIEQKRQLRKIAEDEMRLSAGKAVSLVSTSQQKKQEFSALPPASQFSGKIATDQQTGIKYKSDGNQWVRVK